MNRVVFTKVWLHHGVDDKVQVGTRTSGLQSIQRGATEFIVSVGKTKVSKPVGFSVAIVAYRVFFGLRPDHCAARLALVVSIEDSISQVAVATFSVVWRDWRHQRGDRVHG
jgi:hypothetical protein